MSAASVPAVGTTPPASPEASNIANRASVRRGPALQAFIWVLNNPSGLAGLIILITLIILAISANVIAPYDPIQQHPGQELLPPGGAFPLGTDELGRDLLSRILYGSRISFMVGILAVAIGSVIGIGTGMLAGFFGGWVDMVIMRFYDALQAFPGILLGIAIVSILGPSAVNVAYALGIATLPAFSRLTRSVVLSERERDYVLAARCLGARDFRIMFGHVLPNCMAPLLVQMTLVMGISVLAEAALSFLGLGAQPPDPSWGGMLNNSRAYLREAPWYGILPGVALASMLVGLNYLADAVREALDPRRVRVM
jgi:peptide/nickel transport system permease protein